VKRQQTKRGPKPKILKIEGMNWEEAVQKSFQKKKPAEGWPTGSRKKSV
jgi:hypothetical protein